MSSYHNAKPIYSALAAVTNLDGTPVAVGGGGGSTTFAGLTDVDVAGVTNGQIVQYNSGTSKWENTTLPASSATYVGLTDVNVPVPQADQMTHFNATSGKFEQVSEMKVDATTRAVAILTTGDIGIQSTGGDCALAADVDASLVAATGTILVQATAGTATVQSTGNVAVQSSAGTATLFATSDVAVTSSTGQINLTSAANQSYSSTGGGQAFTGDDWTFTANGGNAVLNLQNTTITTSIPAYETSMVSNSLATKQYVDDALPTSAPSLNRLKDFTFLSKVWSSDALPTAGYFVFLDSGVPTLDPNSVADPATLSIRWHETDAGGKTVAFPNQWAGEGNTIVTFFQGDGSTPAAVKQGQFTLGAGASLSYSAPHYTLTGFNGVSVQQIAIPNTPGLAVYVNEEVHSLGYTPVAPTIPTVLEDLTDVNFPIPPSGTYTEALMWSGGAWENYTPSLAGLSDTIVSVPEAGQILRWDSSQWVNYTRPVLSLYWNSNGTSSGGTQNQINWVQGAYVTKLNKQWTIVADNGIQFDGTVTQHVMIHAVIEPIASNNDRSVQFRWYKNPDLVTNPTVGLILGSTASIVARQNIGDSEQAVTLTTVDVANGDILRLYCVNTENNDAVTVDALRVFIQGLDVV